jgi:hypothetical protein
MDGEGVMSIAIRQVIVPRFFRYVHQGQVVRVYIQIVDNGVIDTLHDPSQTPEMSLYDSDGVAMFENQEMTKESVGLYFKEHQTSSGDSLGYYTASFSVEDSGKAAVLSNILVFKITKQSVFANVTYLVMADQNGVLWYYYVLIDGTLAISPVIPSFVNRTPFAINDTEISWFTLLNASSQIRYIHPLVDGSLYVSNSQPGVGSGIAGSPIFKGVNGRNYHVELDILEQLVIEEV